MTSVTTADCYDANANAKPGQTAWQTTANRGDGSGDYNCDGTSSSVAKGLYLGYNSSCIPGSSGATYNYFYRPAAGSGCPTGFTWTLMGTSNSALGGGVSCTPYVWYANRVAGSQSYYQCKASSNIYL